MITLILLELLAALAVAVSSQKNYYIVPVESTALCQNYSNETCFTLDQLSAFEISNTEDTTISFLPGEHLLSWNMKFNKASEVTLKSEHLNKSSHPTISCVTNRHIEVTRTKRFTLLGLNISGCRNKQSGGALFAVHSNVFISDCKFVNNSVSSSHSEGGALSLKNCNTTIERSIFSRNSGKNGGALNTDGKESYTSISYTLFEHNHAHQNGGSIYGGHIYSENNTFNNNSAVGLGGAIFIQSFNSSLNSSMNNYTNNTADYGGAVRTESLSNFHNDVFKENKATMEGAAISISQGRVDINTCLFASNYKNNHHGSVIESMNGDILFSGSNNFSNNSITAFTGSNSNAYFTGSTIFTNNTNSENGGAIKSKSSILYYKQGSNTVIRGNTAKFGGGMYLEQSVLQVLGEILMTSNTGEVNGGGLYAFQSGVIVHKYKKLIISKNIAKKDGGGIYLSGASCEIDSGLVYVNNNSANRYGGGIFLEQSSKVILTKSIAFTKSFLHISYNSALKGGGIYIVDNKAICDKEKEFEESVESFMCSIQTMRTAIYYYHASKQYLTNIFLNNNSAIQNGIDIYGGLFDRCTINPEAEILQHFFQYKHYNGVRYLLAIANFNWETQQNFIFDKPDTLVYSNLYNHVSSDPIRLCFCDNGAISDCTSHKTVFKRKGETFTLSLVAVDQVGMPINATLISLLQTENGGIGRLKEGQQMKHIEAQCTELEYNVYASGNEAMLVLYTDGPCEDQGISRREVNIFFQPCICPLGLSQHPSPINCSCDCDERIAQYVSNCSSENGEIQINSKVWINYVNSTNTSQFGFVTQQCPFDYCKERPVDIVLASQREIDQQCAFNRTGRLCGQCEQGLSLVFASSRCHKCSNYYLFLLLPFALAGIALIAFILLLNMTVATGTIHGLVFYANILAANRAILLPFETPNFLTIFISWLNLDLGIETCFYNGMDSYGKFLLQLVFPSYVFLLIAIIMVLCDHSQRIANLLGKKNPEATLYTLILLSYSKLIRIIITALQFEVIKYPGTTKIIWLYDANILYFTASHIPRFLTAFIIIILGAVYTILLLFGQLFNRCSEHKLMRWTTHNYYIHFLRTHHAPLSDKHRYWVGLLLFARLVHYLISTFADNSIVILSVGIITFLLLVLKLWRGQVYNKRHLDNLESSFLLNLGIFSISIFYIRDMYGHIREVSQPPQQILATVSMSVSFLAFLGIVFYHILDTCGFKLGELPNKVLTKLRECYHHRPVAIENMNQAEFVEDDENQSLLSGDYHIPSYNRTNRTDPACYITPPIMRSAVPADQLREPALDDLIPVRPEDYNIPPAPRPQPREPTFTEIDIRTAII